ncbi:hypothetical protein UA08_02869 [Talaromyces atroroseus]|uniref:Roadblock/LAMTOR2 domain-containing protein n=1 Tax=Talaromyces atroroseus TaxID=1441469 RepID=A0A225AY65_TALAT|nr:hypothetical protein UA08_02869 [Talaromyces atroroseus]OKL62268.1 hypothetical protein UA08_02869 [Talaromyces atroroseus]
MDTQNEPSQSNTHEREHEYDYEYEHALERTRSFDEEPKQPTNLPNTIENALQTVDDAKSAADKKAKRQHHQKSTALTSDDVKYLFSGAPHFMLEKGHHNHWYPHVLFPWDTSLPIQDLWDREMLRHESFTLSTLHAHLPVPKNLPFKGTSERGKDQAAENWKYEDGVKRSSYDLGIFEVPNMLSRNGKEPGAIGFRHYLELATADAVRYKQDVPRGESLDPHLLANVPLTEAFDTLSHLRDPYSQCHQDIIFDRHKLLCEGPAAWKRIGIRDVHINDIVDRLEKLSNLRLEALKQYSAASTSTSTGEEKPGQNKTITILDKESTELLHKELYTKFLFPPPRGWSHHAHEELKNQIEVITRVLAVKGAWLNLSLPEWRLRVGQILWEMPPHADGDCMDCIKPLGEKKTPKPSSSASPTGPSNLNKGLERKWLLLQLVFAGELLIRLDAIVQLAVLQNSKDMSVTAQDMRELDKLRHGKVNWDILFFQRFSDNLTIKYLPKSSFHLPGQSEQQQQKQEGTRNPAKQHGLLSKFGGISKHFHSNSSHTHSPQESSLAESSSSDPIWDCIAISARHPERQLKGLSVFAETLEWPGYEALEARIRSNVQQKEGETMTTETVSLAYSVPVKNTETSRLFSKKDTYTRNPRHRYLVLHRNKSGENDAIRGGWLSRAWLTGLVMPGENISHLLMATLLENDPNALHTLGTVANLYGGLSYGDQGCTWWSTQCVVGRVLAALDGSRVCTGWVKTSITPVHDHGDEKKTPLKLTDTWFSIEGVQEPLQKNTRIRQGTRLAIESNPLGRGRVSNDTFTIPLDDDDKEKNRDVSMKLNGLTLSRPENAAASINNIFVADRASLAFEITTTATTSSTESRHPLHKSYAYKHVSLQDLRASTRPPVVHFTTPTHNPTPTPASEKPPTETDGEVAAEEEPVWILDARCSRDKEVFARACLDIPSIAESFRQQSKIRMNSAQVPQHVSALLSHLTSRPGVQSTLILSRKDGSIIQSTGLLATTSTSTSTPHGTGNTTTTATTNTENASNPGGGGGGGGGGTVTGSSDPAASSPESVPTASAQSQNTILAQQPYKPSQAEALAAHIFAFMSGASGLALSLSGSTGSEDIPGFESRSRNVNGTTAGDGAEKALDETATATNMTSAERMYDREEDDEIKLLRLRTKKHEIVVVPDRKYLLCVVHDASGAAAASSSSGSR